MKSVFDKQSKTISIAQMWEIINFDRRWALCRRGKTILKQIRGIPAGSPAAPFIANLTASFLERGMKTRVLDIESMYKTHVVPMEMVRSTLPALVH